MKLVILRADCKNESVPTTAYGDKNATNNIKLLSHAEVLNRTVTEMNVVASI